MDLKKYIYYIFIFVLQPFLFGQSFHNKGIAENYEIKEVRNGDEVLNEKQKDTLYYIYSYNNSKERVRVYTKSSTGTDGYFEVTDYKLSKKTLNKLNLTIKGSDDKSRQLEITFFDKDKSIGIDKSVFFLNDTYYSYLKKELLEKRNMSELVDVMDDFLQEDIFNLENLRYFSSKQKYIAKNFRILKAKMTTANAQNETIVTNWTIYYSYNKNGVLSSVEQKVKDEIRYTKTLINATKNILYYKIYRQIDERFSDDKKITMDLVQNKYSETGTFLQVGLNKETDYEKLISKSTHSVSSKIELSKNELMKIYQEMK